MSESQHPDPEVVCDGTSCRIVRKNKKPLLFDITKSSESTTVDQNANIKDRKSLLSADAKTDVPIGTVAATSAVAVPFAIAAGTVAAVAPVVSKGTIGTLGKKTDEKGVGSAMLQVEHNGRLDDDDEEILRESGNRFVLFPIRYDGLYRLYKTALASFWTVEEIDLASDMKDWEALTEPERFFIKHVLAFFAAADGIVIENLAMRFMSDVQIPEAKCFYAAQIQQEAIHSETYSILLDTFVQNTAEKAELFNAIKTMPAVKAKADWALKWMASSKSFAERLVAFAAVEMIMFSGSFCAIYWVKKRGKMAGLTFSNEKIAADEGLHCEFAAKLFELLKHKPEQKVVHEIIKSALEAERQFVCESLPVGLIGMNATTMTQYIEFVADFLLDRLGYEKAYNVQNPFDWMDMISMNGKTNFFEKRVGEYQRAHRTHHHPSTSTSSTLTTLPVSSNAKASAGQQPIASACQGTSSSVSDKPFVAELDC